jgi:peptidoglycan/LPS O-acetylase OafA/YrhL
MLLSLMVIDAHYGAFRSMVQPALVNAFGVDRLGYIGEGGVAIAGFFVISGYVIAYVLFHKYDTSSWRGIGVFLTSRALRIYPLYWLMFALYWATLIAIGRAPDFTAGRLANNLLLLPVGVFALLGDHVRLGPAQMTGQFLIGPSWTLCFDLLLYVLAPFLLVSKRVLWAVFALGIVYFAVFIVVLDPRPPFWFAALYTSAIVYLFAFVCGALVFHYGDRLAPSPALLALTAVAVAWLTYFPLGFTNAPLNHLLVILCMAVLVAGLKNYAQGVRRDRFFGDLTYATYLIHLPMLLVLEQLAFAHPAAWALVLTYLLGALLLPAFEYPMDRLRDRVHDRLQRPIARGTREATPSFPIVTACVFVALTAAATASVLRNGIGAGMLADIRVSECPDRWTCAAEPGNVTFVVRGAGTAHGQPPVRASGRVVADIGNSGDAGVVVAGMQAGEPGGVIAGIRREGGRCALVIEHDGRTESAPSGWNPDCARTHRFVIDGSGDYLVVAVDSLWVYSTSQRPGALTPFVHADGDAAGTVGFTGIVAK